MRANQTPPPNTLKDVEPLLATLSEGKEVRLNEISSVVIVAEAADEFPQHVLKKIFDLAPDKGKILTDLVGQLSCLNTLEHIWEQPFLSTVEMLSRLFI